MLPLGAPKLSLPSRLSDSLGFEDELEVFGMLYMVQKEMPM